MQNMFQRKYSCGLNSLGLRDKVERISYKCTVTIVRQNKCIPSLFDSLNADIKIVKLLKFILEINNVF
jgi:hypothetical protein